MKSKKQVLAIIPARGGSKGIKRKNMSLLAGKPLIQYTLEAAKKCKLINRIILSSDDSRIISFCKRNSIDAPFIRPANLAGDEVPMVEVVKYALDYLWKNQHYKPEIVVLLQPTSPLRRSYHIYQALRLLEKTGADTVVSVVEVPHNCNPYSIMKVDGLYLRHFKSFKERENLRQRKPKFYARNGPAVLAFKYEVLKKRGSMYGKKIVPYFMKKEESIDIDDHLDLQLAEWLLKKS